jgi:hypothetical protein
MLQRQTHLLICSLLTFLCLWIGKGWAADVKVQWRLNFDHHQPADNIGTYTPDTAAGEIPPDGKIELIDNSSDNSPALVRLLDGREVLWLNGEGPGDCDGLRLTHSGSGRLSRILEIVIAPDPSTGKGQGWSNLLSINDAPRKGGNMELRLLNNRTAMLAARNQSGVWTSIASDLTKQTIPADKNTFTHIAGVYDDERKALYLYVNGQFADALGGFEISEGDYEIIRGIGVSNANTGNGFTGYIDDVAESTFTGTFTPSDFVLIKAAGPAPVAPQPDRQVELVLPKDILDLPKLPSTRHVVYRPRGLEDLTYHHGALIVPWKGRLYVAWQATSRDEHTNPYLGMLSRSNDMSLSEWSNPVFFGKENNDAWLAAVNKEYKLDPSRPVFINVAPRMIHATEDRIYLWCLGWTSEADKDYKDAAKNSLGRIFWTSDGEIWNEIPPEELDSLEKEKGLTESIRTTASNHQFAGLRDGRVMAFNLSPDGLWCPTTSDTTGLTGWGGGKINSSACADIGEPGGWEGPDGVLHGTARWGEFIWHAYSLDGGKVWSKLSQQTRFSDCPGNKDFGVFPNQWVWYVGNPVPGSRETLVLGISHDGWSFDQNYLVRWEPHQQLYPAPYKGGTGYQYPTGCYHDGFLYVAYSVARDFMEVSKVDVSKILNLESSTSR